MTERPILFSGPMVRAILAGRKTVTRRVVTSRHPIALIGSSDERGDPSAWGYFFDGPDHHGYMVLGRGHADCHDHGKVSIPCPYGAAGDRLWVRETFCLRDPEHHPERGYWYAATDDVDEPRWTPSIHMPRRASRLTLEVVGVRVERLQEIDELDALNEGVQGRAVGRHQRRPRVMDEQPVGVARRVPAGASVTDLARARQARTTPSSATTAGLRPAKEKPRHERRHRHRVDRRDVEPDARLPPHRPRRIEAVGVRRR